mmetsp:Transcript_5578/g.6928  ORF Transcript_5578/g.6928 Transcript_5578/m.6928 type:complete len:192 (+) Transcript_5578:100-675(+)|eukprot:CAMPEP_0114352186 /NCGR_PEP_ID=MMETSP0101-20121206/17756_1 /TAXON_ID=38822 ORGANISM="Pteridomonas danica, Strain PT" /NCGR_SAMPLE_ID=MMETSP0101 /ASSEMBLY_ACC=CAM_ASM_000211 /LENGTH=191 /DNA_ID=CAMNT_0001492459 /DNA_START=108 /DNA_END=683 /DNA_ORIENTATION=+
MKEEDKQVAELYANSVARVVLEMKERLPKEPSDLQLLEIDTSSKIAATAFGVLSVVASYKLSQRWFLPIRLGFVTVIGSSCYGLATVYVSKRAIFNSLEDLEKPSPTAEILCPSLAQFQACLNDPRCKALTESSYGGRTILSMIDACRRRQSMFESFDDSQEEFKFDENEIKTNDGWSNDNNEIIKKDKFI